MAISPRGVVAAPPPPVPVTAPTLAAPAPTLAAPAPISEVYSGVAVPTRTFGFTHTPNAPIYPFADMEIGDSFLVEVEGDPASDEFKADAKKLANKISGAARNYGIANLVTFTTRTVTDDRFGEGAFGVGCWRLEYSEPRKRNRADKDAE